MKLLSKRFDKISQLVTLEFDKDLTSINFNNLMFSLKNKSIIPDKPKISENSFITFYLNLNETLVGATLSISALENLTIISKDQMSYFNSYPITISIDYIKSSAVIILRNSAKAGQAVTNGATGIISLISLNAAIIIVKLV